MGTLGDGGLSPSLETFLVIWHLFGTVFLHFSLLLRCIRRGCASVYSMAIQSHTMSWVGPVSLTGDDVLGTALAAFRRVGDDGSILPMDELVLFVLANTVSRSFLPGVCVWADGTCGAGTC